MARGMRFLLIASRWVYPAPGLAAPGRRERRYRAAVEPLRIGVLGCGPIAQFAHLEAGAKAHGVELHALCDAAPALLERAAARYAPTAAYASYDELLADERVEAVLVAIADQLHVAACERALAAGKHVLVEKPLGVAVEECERLRRTAASSGLLLQVGTMKRFDPGIAYAADF